MLIVKSGISLDRQDDRFHCSLILSKSKIAENVVHFDSCIILLTFIRSHALKYKYTHFLRAPKKGFSSSKRMKNI